MKPSEVIGLTLASPFLLVGGAVIITGAVLLISADLLQRVTCSHEWKYIGFWRDRAEGEHERECKNCRKCEWTNEVDKSSLMYGLANLELK